MRSYILSLLIIAGLLLYGCVNPFGGTNSPDNRTGVCPTNYEPVCGKNGVTYSNLCLANAANVTVDYQGVCRNQTTTTCSDSDYGRDIFVKGTALDSRGSSTDSCVSTSVVVENYCSNNAVTRESINCPEGYSCADGSCIRRQNGTTNNNTNTTPQNGCIDSDSGRDYYTRGSVTFNGARNEDTCADVRLVKEYYCDNGVSRNENYQCPSGYRCESGRCSELQNTCSDNDDGNDMYRRGTVTVSNVLTSQTYRDDCVDSNTLTEYYCVGNEQRNTEIDCPRGYTCSNGRCETATCSDSDGGRDYYTSGSVTKGSDSWDDVCTSSTRVREYYCSSNNVQDETYLCPGGYECTSGRCQRSTPVSDCYDPDHSRTDTTRATTVTHSGEAPGIDTCLDSTTVVEFYCNSAGNIQADPVSCRSGYSCSAGVCVRDVIAPCSDSDGYDIYTQGTTNQGESTKIDSCVGSTVTEWYCDAGRITANDQVCPLGCAVDGSGACSRFA